MTKPIFTHPLEALHYHVSGAIARGEATPITEVTNVERTYIIGSNMPSFLPDREPYTVVGTFDDAKRSMLADLWYEEINAIDEDEATEFENAQKDVALWSGPDSIRCGQYVYWISEGE
jgi:hypothetical protein